MKILLAGDSTVAACPSYEYPMSGWGAELAPLVYQWAAVYNFAKGGASTESFRLEGLWDALLERTEPGDAVLMQFGHNDQKQHHLAAVTGYSSNLEHMISEVHAVGARPIVCTPVERRNFRDGVQRATLADYAKAAVDVAQREGVPLIDLSAWTTQLYSAAGEGQSCEYFTHIEPATHAFWHEGLKDDTHFSRAGAAVVAARVASELHFLNADLK